jgi:hypothetical protein
MLLNVDMKRLKSRPASLQIVLKNFSFFFEFLVENAWMVGLCVLYTICMISCFEVESVQMYQLLVQMKVCSNIFF